jgi:hypothetical protein
MPLGNWVMLKTGQPERMHFADHTEEKRTITSPTTGRPEIRNSLVMDVDMLNGLPVSAKFSTMAEGLYAKLEPYLVEKRYLEYYFSITANGEGYQRKYTVLPTPLT